MSGGLLAGAPLGWHDLRRLRLAGQSLKWGQATPGVGKGDERNMHVEESGLLLPRKQEAFQACGVPGALVTIGRLPTMRLRSAAERCGPQGPRSTLWISGHLHSVFQAGV